MNWRIQPPEAEGGLPSPWFQIRLVLSKLPHFLCHHFRIKLDDAICQ